MNKYAMCGCQERSTEMRKPVTKVDSGIEQDAPPSGTNPQLLILSPVLLKHINYNYKKLILFYLIRCFYLTAFLDAWDETNEDEVFRRHNNRSYGIYPKKEQGNVWKGVDEGGDRNSTRRETIELPCSIGKYFNINLT